MNPDRLVVSAVMCSRPGGGRTLTRPSGGSCSYTMWSSRCRLTLEGSWTARKGKVDLWPFGRAGRLIIGSGQESDRANCRCSECWCTSDDEENGPAVFTKNRSGWYQIGGGVMLTETTAGAWGDGRGVSPNKDWIQSKIGFDPSKAISLPIREAVNTGGDEPRVEYLLQAWSQRPSLTAHRSEPPLERFLRLTLLPVAETIIADELTRRS